MAVGNVLALVRHIHGAENDVVMQVAFVDVGSNHIGVFDLKFNIRRFIGTAIGRNEQFFIGLVRVLDIVQRLFQR